MDPHRKLISHVKRESQKNTFQRPFTLEHLRDVCNLMGWIRQKGRERERERKIDPYKPLESWLRLQDVCFEIKSFRINTLVSTFLRHVTEGTFWPLFFTAASKKLCKWNNKKNKSSSCARKPYKFSLFTIIPLHIILITRGSVCMLLFTILKSTFGRKKL